MFDDCPSPCSRLLRSHLHAHSSPLSAHGHYTHRATKASDIAHLLDPSYSSARTHDTQIYIDHAGEAHDPDFRFFAVHASPKRRWIPEPATHNNDDDNNQGVSFYSARDASLHTPHPSSRESHTYTYASEPMSFSYDAYIPRKYDDEPIVEPRRETNKLRRRCFPADSVRHPITPPAPTAPVPARTYTRSQALRRRWHILLLRTQLTAFRARRRFKRAIRKTK